jgi:predicted membrane-bound mannosyltransferase
LSVCLSAVSRRCRAVFQSSCSGVSQRNLSLGTCAAFVNLPALAGIDVWNAQAQSVDPQTREVLVYLAKTLIAWGVPVFSIGVVAFFVISAASRGRRNDMVGFRALHIPMRV